MEFSIIRFFSLVHTRKLDGTNLKKKNFCLLGESEDIDGNGDRMTGLVPAVSWQEVFGPGGTETVKMWEVQQPSCSVDPAAILCRNSHDLQLHYSLCVHS